MAVSRYINFVERKKKQIGRRKFRKKSQHETEKHSHLFRLLSAIIMNSSLALTQMLNVIMMAKQKNRQRQQFELYEMVWTS